MQEKSWRRSHVEGVTEGIWRQRHPGATKEACRSIQEAPRSPGDPHGTRRKLPGTTRGVQRHPDGTQRRPGGSHRTREFFGVTCVKTILRYNKK